MKPIQDISPTFDPATRQISSVLNGIIIINIITTTIIIIIIIIIIIEPTHSKTILETTVEIEPQPAALDCKNLSQYSSCSK